MLLFPTSLSRTGINWMVMDLSDTASLKKYHINICRPLNPVAGCDRHASVCQTQYIVEEVTAAGSLRGAQRRR